MNNILFCVPVYYILMLFYSCIKQLIFNYNCFNYIILVAYNFNILTMPFDIYWLYPKILVFVISENNMLFPRKLFKI